MAQPLRESVSGTRHVVAKRALSTACCRKSTATPGAVRHRLLSRGGACRGHLAGLEQCRGATQFSNAGRALMRELSDAAARDVRVRVLVDDLYTVGVPDREL
jgi:hypothetical protein